MNQVLMFISSTLLVANMTFAAHGPPEDMPSEEFCRRNPGSNFCGDVNRKKPITKPPPGPPTTPGTSQPELRYINNLNANFFNP
jgi:hypothetical protein